MQPLTRLVAPHTVFTARAVITVAKATTLFSGDPGITCIHALARRKRS